MHNNYIEKIKKEGAAAHLRNNIDTELWAIAKINNVVKDSGRFINVRLQIKQAELSISNIKTLLDALNAMGEKDNWG